jgi:excisionase family DNA binding protein
MLSVKAAADRAGVSPALIYLWCEERRLIHYRLGGNGRRGKIAIRPDDLDAFMESCKVTQAASLPEGLQHIQPPS